MSQQQFDSLVCQLSHLVILLQRHSDFAINMEHTLDVYRSPYDLAVPVDCSDENAWLVDRRNGHTSSVKSRSTGLLRFSPLRQLQSLHGHGAVGQQSFNQGDRATHEDGMDL